MGEMDMGDQTGTPGELDTTTAEEVSREERAEQRRAEARAQLDPPTHFDTPAWLGPSSREYAAPEIPVQAEPTHDQLHADAPAPLADSVPDTGHWVEHRKPRLFVGVLLSACLLGAIASLFFAVVNQSAVAVLGLVACGLLVVIFRGALMSSGLTTVDLKGSTLKIRREGDLSIFNLADPTHQVEIFGTPDSTSWKVVLESLDHRELTLTAAHVNPTEFHKVVTYYRNVAEQERQAKFDRFNR